jgi:predicted AAA+ superfamily ATPase
MQKYNSPQFVGDFYDKPSVHGESRPIEIIYNLIHGGIPTTVNFAYKFDKSILDIIQEKFELFSSGLTYGEEKVFEEAIWVSKNPQDKIVVCTANGARTDGIFYTGNPENKKDDDRISLRVACTDKITANELAKIFISYKKTSKTNIYILTAGYGDLNLTPLPIKSMEDMDLELNYGKDFSKIHDKVLKSLNDQESGLLLFNGEPGTGKSSYIKYLCSGIIKRKIAYIPVSLINQLTSPQMLPLLTENKDIVLVLEDAEKALISRDVSEYTDIVQSILNLTDGILGGALNVSIIATFNTDKEKIDAALLRKGRLRVSYEFKKLSLDQTITLAKSLNKNIDIIKEGMTLADIYNIEEDSGYVKEEKRLVGFNQV